MDNPPVLLGTVEACKILRIDRSTLTRWVATGQLKPRGRIGGNAAFVFYETEIRELATKIAREKLDEARAAAAALETEEATA